MSQWSRDAVCRCYISDVINYSLRSYVEWYITDEQFYAWNEQAREMKKECDREAITLVEFQKWLKNFREQSGEK